MTLPLTSFVCICDAGYEVLQELEENWSKVLKLGNQGLRRYLGKVGVDSPLYRIDKAFIAIHDNVINTPTPPKGLDRSVYEKKSSEVLMGIDQADYLAYTSEYVPPSQRGEYLSACRDWVGQTRGHLGEVIQLLQPLARTSMV